MPERRPALDPLTRALTRPAFVTALRERADAAARSGATFCVCLIDVDSLKSVNDRRGLHAGDKVLAALAKRVRAILADPGWHPTEHLLARYDGDALIVLAHPCGLREGEQLAEALRFHVASAHVYDRVGITVSIAVAQFRIGESVDELLARTERTLHVAKQFGRDRVEIAATPESRVERATVKKLPD